MRFLIPVVVLMDCVCVRLSACLSACLSVCLERVSEISEVNNVLSVSGDDQFRSALLMLKIFEASTRASLTDISHMLENIQSRLLGDEDRGGKKISGGDSPGILRTTSASSLGPPSLVACQERAVCGLGAEGEEIKRPEQQSGQSGDGKRSSCSHLLEAFNAHVADQKQARSVQLCSQVPCAFS